MGWTRPAFLYHMQFSGQMQQKEMNLMLLLSKPYRRTVGSTATEDHTLSNQHIETCQSAIKPGQDVGFRYMTSQPDPCEVAIRVRSQKGVCGKPSGIWYKIRTTYNLKRASALLTSGLLSVLTSMTIELTLSMSASMVFSKCLACHQEGQLTAWRV